MQTLYKYNTTTKMNLETRTISIETY